MKKLFLLLVISIFTFSCGPNLPDDLKHSLNEKVTQDTSSENCKTYVLISREVTEEELAELGEHYNSFCAFDKNWIFYYVEGDSNQEAYATTHFSPKIKIDIL